MRFLIFSLVFWMLRIVFNVFSMMFAKIIMSLLFCCFCIRLFGTNNVCVVPYGVMRNLDAIIRVSNYVRLNPGLQRARSLWSGASDKLIMPILPAEWEFMQPSQSCKMAVITPHNIQAQEDNSCTWPRVSSYPKLGLALVFYRKDCVHHSRFYNVRILALAFPTGWHSKSLLTERSPVLPPNIRNTSTKV